MNLMRMKINEIKDEGRKRKPDKGKVAENPIIDTSVKYFKMADIAWGKIWDIVAQNCEQNFGGNNPHSDAMLKLLQYNPGRG